MINIRTHKNNASEWLQSSLFLALFLIFCIPMASAALPIISYNEAQKTYEYRDWLGIGFGKNYDISLIENPANCKATCYAILNVHAYSDFSPSDIGIKFNDILKRETGVNSFSYQTLQEEEYDCIQYIPATKDYCYISNLTLNQECVKQSYNMIKEGKCTRKAYKDINLKDAQFSKDTDTLIRLKIEKNVFDSFDWIMNFDSKWLSEWAWINSSTFTEEFTDATYIDTDNTTAKLDTTNGKVLLNSTTNSIYLNNTYDWDFSNAHTNVGTRTLTPVLGSINLKYSPSVTTGVAGLNNQAYYAHIASADEITAQINISNATQYTILIWINLSNANNNAPFFSIDDNAGDYNNILYARVNQPNKQQVYGTFGGANTINFATAFIMPNEYASIAYVQNATDFAVYINGKWNASTSNTKTFKDFSVQTYNLSVGGINYAGETSANSMIDELYVWQRALTPAEILTLNSTFLNGVTGSYQNGSVVSTNLNSSKIIYKATTDWNMSMPAGTSVNCSLRTNSAYPWEYIEKGIEHTFTNPGVGIYYNCSMNTTDVSITPYISQLNITAGMSSISTALKEPANATQFLTTNDITFKCNVTTVETTLKNTTLYIWDDAGLYYNNTNTTPYGDENLTSWHLIDFPDGDYRWNCLANEGIATDWADSNFSFHVAQNNITLQLCGLDPTVNMTFLNITFKNEATSDFLNATIDALTFDYYLSGFSFGSKTYTFANTTDYNLNYTFCAAPNWTTLITGANIQYSHGTGFPQRSYNANLTLTNATTSKTLYLLGSTAGQYVTFQVINSALQPISGVTITAERTGLGVIESKVTDASGAATLWLNPLYAHTITASKTGYTTNSASITPSQTSYTITLSAISSSNVTDTASGITYSILPADLYLNETTSYNFQFIIAASSSNLQRYGYNITNSSGNIIATNNGTAAAGSTISNALNTGSNQSFTMYAFWTIDNTSVVVSKTWTISNMTMSQYSISHFSSDLKNYVGVGFFGIDEFGLNLIIFILIFIVTGVASYNFGITSPTAITGIVFGMVAVFDVGFGLILNPVGAVAHFPTVFIGLILIALIIKEATSY